MSLEEQLEQQTKNLESIERRRLLFDKGLSEADLIQDELKAEAIALQDVSASIQAIIQKVHKIAETGDENLENRIDAIRRAEELIASFSDFTESVNSLTLEASNILTSGIDTITKLLTDMNTKLDAEIVKSDEQRELEKETLDRINKYIRKYA